jgi:hypothetical protein
VLAVIVGFNLADVSEFFRSIPGPEDAMAGRPMMLVTVILLQIVVTIWAVWWGAGKVPTDVRSVRNAVQSVLALPITASCGNHTQDDREWRPFAHR